MDEFHTRLRELRAARGISLRALAKQAFYTKSYLHELETGAKAPSARAARQIDNALGAGGELAALATGQPGLRRREVIARAGLAVALPHTILECGSKVGSAVPQQLADRTARLRRLDDFLGGADTVELFTGEMESTRSLIQHGTYAETTGRGLLTVLGEQAQLAGWAAFDAGRLSDADRLFRTSRAAALDAGDTGLAGNAFAFLAYQESDQGRAARHAAAACETAGPDATPTVRALLHLRRAWVHALGGVAAAAERHLDIGTACLTEVRDRPEPDWVYWVDRSEAAIMTGRCWTVLRRPLRAIPVLEAVLAAYPATHARDKALYQSWLAESWLDAHEVEQACATAAGAAHLAAGVASVRPAQRIEALLNRLTPYAALPCVADLRGLVTDLRLTHPARPGTPPIPPRSE
ncbi:helix-turn-helix transcriptional regulator [Solwaraspora sp. WMMD1047]|uniref:helix-turn-helix domain-containing protein n=1 Tax=Solwaraspora sp. WMMD1047 TaxID=3016102 RepID=UPI002415F8D7|nr:helix-turn-helix transcriptional regulator [Solwaraspora sp. WMMD1047]MDG4832379.1 helix-turn-helix transcriptional regulator [Solwaraspora sp. WMMD1047]